jgi:hypothetical protein
LKAEDEENIQLSSKFQVVRNKLMNFVKDEHLNEFDLLLKDLDGLKSAILILRSLVPSPNDIKLLQDWQIKKFVKDAKEYKISDTKRSGYGRIYYRN